MTRPAAREDDDDAIHFTAKLINAATGVSSMKQAAAPESETPEAVHAQLARKGPNFGGRIRDVIKALRGENEKTVDRAVGHLIGCRKGEMIFRRVALKKIERLERTLSLAQTEIKDWKIAFDGLIAAAEVKTATINGLQARIAELENKLQRALSSLRSYDSNLADHLAALKSRA